MKVHEFYNWNHLITPDMRFNMCKDINHLIAKGNYWTNSPKYQTNINIFGLPQSYWTNLKMSFIWSCFAFMEKEVKIKNIQSWSYRTSLKDPEDRDILWHHHNHDTSTTTISGVYYLHLPVDVDNDLVTAGTELAPNGVEGEGKYFVPWKHGHWMIYPGETWHRPGILNCEEDRFIVAADLEY